MIYFVQAGTAVKIGMTTGRTLTTVFKRINDLQVANHEELRLLAVLPGKTGTERQIHKRFSASAIRGEWFLCTTDLMTFIRTEAITVDRLPEFEKSCIICDSRYLPTTRGDKYCSDGCSEKRICVACGTRFVPEKPAWKSYCSSECYWKNALT